MFDLFETTNNSRSAHTHGVSSSSLELCAAITVLVFSQCFLLVSTFMCITGATVGVGLCTGSIRAVNWQRVDLLIFSWIMTTLLVRTIGGLAMGIILHASQFISPM